ncbi:hypothetical protein EJ06DRAFT_554378 [Trichodelitschia bisporula]|uniref:Uncharacterized protein n=1 Tax=Trichodelitschia bisporula TaxID=703511 RepID=A0A6G1I431_9PEZI|nr:hypothetical protein EJ06DRAFT_554378 [Trichodelitschia bisporula]
MTSEASKKRGRPKKASAPSVAAAAAAPVPAPAPPKRATAFPPAAAAAAPTNKKPTTTKGAAGTGPTPPKRVGEARASPASSAAAAAAVRAPLRGTAPGTSKVLSSKILSEVGIRAKSRVETSSGSKSSATASVHELLQAEAALPGDVVSPPGQVLPLATGTPRAAAPPPNSVYTSATLNLVRLQQQQIATMSHKATPPKEKPSAKGMNAFAVNDISSRAGARGGMPPRPGDLADKYKPAARRVTAIIVALPIAIVTSYFLYERVVLGVEQKRPWAQMLPAEPPVSPAEASAVIKGGEKAGEKES